MKESFVPLPLPSYNMFRLIKENPWMFTIMSTLLTISITAFLWKYWQSKRIDRTQKKQNSSGRYEKSLDQGCFNSDALKGIRRYVFSDEENSDLDKDSPSRTMDAYLDYENVGPLNPRSKNKEKSLAHEEKTVMSCAGGFHSSENDGEDNSEEGTASAPSKKASVSDELVKSPRVMGSLKTLHGKLATADMNLKARRLEQSMTEEEKKEEALVRKKQLESIYALMALDKERFGVHDESEFMDQMKLYSFSR